MFLGAEVLQTGQADRSHATPRALIVRDQYFALDHRRGRYALSSALKTSGKIPGLSDYDIRNAIFLDIESGPRTPGSEGIGLVVGVGRFEPFYFRLRQLYHREASAATDVLTALDELLEDAKCVVTFNGNTFDMPHLASLYRAAGIPGALAGLPHLDLLQTARLVIGPSLKSRRLAEIEELMGVQRPHPAMGYTHPLLEHNANDVLSLPVLFAHLSRHADRLSRSDPRYLVAIGRLYEQRGDLARASAAFRAAWSLDRCGLSGGDAVVRLTRLLNGERRWPEAASLWEEELRESQRVERQVRASVELGKLFEHRLRQPTAALDVTRRALDLIERTATARKFEKSHAGLIARASRLEARLGVKVPR